MQLIVPDDKLSLAIGKKGQNVRLASQLSGWRIDIHSEAKVREMETRARSRWPPSRGWGRAGLRAPSSCFRSPPSCAPAPTSGPAPRGWQRRGRQQAPGRRQQRARPRRSAAPRSASAPRPKPRSSVTDEEPGSGGGSGGLGAPAHRGSRMNRRPHADPVPSRTSWAVGRSARPRSWCPGADRAGGRGGRALVRARSLVAPAGRVRARRRQGAGFLAGVSSDRELRSSRRLDCGRDGGRATPAIGEKV
jgi:hypothetical protein